MRRYGMYLKNKKDLIHITSQDNKENAISFFAQIKKMPISEFNKIFIVKEIKDNDQ